MHTQNLQTTTNNPLQAPSQPHLRLWTPQIHSKTLSEQFRYEDTWVQLKVPHALCQC